MNNKKLILSGLVAIAVAGAAWAGMTDPRSAEVVEFFSGHNHEDGQTHGAPSHSGGTNKYGCHNASVPYHCH